MFIRSVSLNTKQPLDCELVIPSFDLSPQQNSMRILLQPVKSAGPFGPQTGKAFAAGFQQHSAAVTWLMFVLACCHFSAFVKPFVSTSAHVEGRALRDFDGSSLVLLVKEPKIYLVCPVQMTKSRVAAGFYDFSGGAIVLLKIQTYFLVK